MTSPADELRTAATKLRQAASIAAQLSPPPWVVTDELVIRCSNKERGIVADRSCEPDEAGDLEFIAAMHPGVGAALADWLDDTAVQLDGVPFPVTHPPALAVARQINAGGGAA